MELRRKETAIRILKIEIENFKNISHGIIEFPGCHAVKKKGCAFGRDVIGLYGQNGSGKTALVEALTVWKLLMQEQELPENLNDYIRQDTKLRINFLVCNEGSFYQIEQELSLYGGKKAIEYENTLFYRIWENERWSRRRRVRGRIKEPDRRLIHMLRRYACNGLWVVTTEQLGLVNLNIGESIDFTYKEENGAIYAEKRIFLFDENTLSLAEMGKIDRMIQQLNIVLRAILPGYQILIEAVEEGELCNFNLLANRNDKSYPLKNESSGLKRIISILTILIAGYNSLSLCVVIDEVDAGIFEYLLGELLEMMRNGAKGQFLFTSHNLRALEVLGADHIVFSTSNPSNRYIRFSSRKKIRNLRDEYLRSILLGGQAEAVYEEAGSYEMGYAFRKAGRLYDET